MPLRVRSNTGPGARGRSATMAELIQPSDGSMVEFWCHRMSQQCKEGTGIRGWFRDGLFWSRDNADHYAPGEVTHWVSILHAAPVADCGEAGHDQGRCGNASCLGPDVEFSGVPAGTQG